MAEFILMLTRNDQTVTDAPELLDGLADLGLRHIGFKDVGVDVPTMRSLRSHVRDLGASCHVEVVSLTAQDEVRSAQVAVDLGVDFLIGGTHHELVGPIAREAGIRYYPYIGEVSGHPAVLDGSPAELAAAADQLGRRFDGVNLLAFRHRVADPLDVLHAVNATAVDVICAGSIASLDTVRTVCDAGTWAFTIGGAVLDRVVVPGAPLREQVRSVLETANAGSEP